MALSEEEWLARLAAEVGVSAPSEAERDALLALAGTAAHASVRTAAPLSCWLIGRAGIDPESAEALVRRLVEEFTAG